MRFNDNARSALVLLAVAALAACGDDPVRPEPATLRPPAASLAVTSGVTITELGALAGYPDAWGFAINDLGQVAGSHDNGGLSVATFWTSAGEPQALGAADWSSGMFLAFDISNQGEVVGWGRPVEREPGQFAHALLWTAAGGLRDLGVLPGDDHSFAWAINDQGQVVGYSSRSSSFGSPVTRAFRWSAVNGMQDLGVLGGYAHSQALGINNLGQVVGYSYNVSPQVRRAFLWTAEEGMRDLGTLPGHSQSEAYDINDHGQVVGISHTGNHVDGRAFLWTAAEGMRDLGTLGGATSLAFGINSQGQVVGYSLLPSGGRYHAFLWTESRGMQDLGTTPDGFSSIAYDINNQGEVVGLSFAASLRAVVWTIAERLAVTIDVKPGNGAEPNPINLNASGGGKVPVAVLTTPDFDARLVDPATATLGDEQGTETPVARRKNGSLMASLEDVDQDGDVDLVLHFELSALLGTGDLTAATTRLVLLADLTDGRQIRGADAVRIVP